MNTFGPEDRYEVKGLMHVIKISCFYSQLELLSVVVVVAVVVVVVMHYFTELTEHSQSGRLEYAQVTVWA